MLVYIFHQKLQRMFGLWPRRIPILLDLRIHLRLLFILRYVAWIALAYSWYIFLPRISARVMPKKIMVAERRPEPHWRMDRVRTKTRQEMRVREFARTIRSA